MSWIYNTLVFVSLFLFYSLTKKRHKKKKPQNFKQLMDAKRKSTRKLEKKMGKTVRKHEKTIGRGQKVKQKRRMNKTRD